MTKKLLMTAALSAMALSALAAGGRKNVQGMAGNDGPVTSGRAAKVLVDQMPRTGKTSCMTFNGLQNVPTQIGQCYKKPRQWIVLETKYTTFGTDDSRFLDQLTFTWHVLLDANTATENKGNRDGLARYSYFSTAVTYFNIPQGSHAASVVLPPSYLERYGEPRAIGFVITNENGDQLGGGTVSEVPGIKNDVMFWDDQSIMDAKDKNGQPLVERRQGLVDRSRTVWALGNPNDYETTIQ